jgi:hypothetical protein
MRRGPRSETLTNFERKSWRPAFLGSHNFSLKPTVGFADSIRLSQEYAGIPNIWRILQVFNTLRRMSIIGSCCFVCCVSGRTEGTGRAEPLPIGSSEEVLGTRSVYSEIEQGQEARVLMGRRTFSVPPGSYVKISIMPTEQIVALLISERDKLTRAIDALQGPTKRRGRPPKNPLAGAAPAAPEPAKPRGRRFTAAQRKQQGERMRAFWAAKKKTAKKAAKAA